MIFSRSVARLALSLCVVSLSAASLCSHSQAQDDALDAFMQQQAAFEQLTGDIDQIVERFQAASEEERPAIREEYFAKIEEIDAQFEVLRSATFAAYQSTGNSNEQVAFMILRLMATDLSKEDYIAAYQIYAMLSSEEPVDNEFYNLAGLACYGVNEFQLAKQNWDMAREAETLTGQNVRFASQLDQLLADWENEVQIRDAEAAAGDLPRAILETNKGTIVIELFENQAPGAVGNFVSLIEAGYYDGLTFHRVLPQFMAQGGCPDGTGMGGPGYNIFCECEREDYRRHFGGTLSMAHAGPNTGGSQFFLTFLPTPHLDGRHTAFGRVIDGWDVLPQLQRIDPNQPSNVEPDQIIRATVENKRDHVYGPTKVEE